MVRIRCKETRAGAYLKHLLLCSAGWLAAWVVQPASAGTNTLTRVGPYGGSTYKVAFHPTNSSIVYATTAAGFYRSTNGGQSWTLVHDRILGQPRGVAVHATQPNRVFAVTNAHGIWASDDAGATLSMLGSSTGILPTGTDVQYSADGSVLYVSTGQQVYRSTDHGTTWVRGGDIPLGESAATNLIVDPTDANRLYMVGYPGLGFQSADGGVTWQSWSVPNGIIDDLAIAPTQPSPRIWAATTNGIRFTDDRGATWTNALSSITNTLTVDPNNPTIVYAGTYEGLLRTQDNGAHWSNIQGDANTGMIQSIAVDPSSSNHLLLAGWAGIASSSDGGAHWISSHTGIDALSSYELVSSPAADRIYINAGHGGVYAISPDGTTPPIDNQALRQVTGSVVFDGRGLVVTPGTPDRLFIAAGGRVVRSLDGGESWSLHPVSSLQGFYQLITASADGSRLLATTGDRLFVTADGADTWTEGPTMGANDLYPMVSAPSNPQVIYVSGRLPGATRDVILRSADGGNTWTTGNFPGTDVLAIAVDPSNDQTLYTGGAGEVFKSTDGGQSWAALNIPGPYAQQGNGFWALAIDPQNPNIVYAGGNSFIARSVDGGASWQQLLYDPDRGFDLRSLLVDPLRPHSVYAAMNGDGVREFSVQPDLQITATDLDFPIPYGTAASYSYRITNAGPFDATNVRARIQLPAGVTNVLASSSAAPCTVAGTIVTCAAPILRTNASADITINATYPSSGDFTVAGTVEGDQPDASPADNSVTSDTTITEMTDLSVTLTAPAFVTRGEQINLTMKVNNIGPNDAAVVSMRLELGVGLNIASASLSGGTSTPTPGALGTCIMAGNVLSCSLPQLPSGGSFTINVATHATAAAGSFSHVATVDGRFDPFVSNNAAGAATTVNSVSQDFVASSRGGGGSTSPFMLAALLLLSGLRAAMNKFDRSARQPLF